MVGQKCKRKECQVTEKVDSKVVFYMTNIGHLEALRLFHTTLWIGAYSVALKTIVDPV